MWLQVHCDTSPQQCSAAHADLYLSAHASCPAVIQVQRSCARRFEVNRAEEDEVVVLFPAHPGLQILYTLLQNVAQEEAAAQSFYQTYFCDILQHIFSVVTDTSHTAGELQQNTGQGCPRGTKTLQMTSFCVCCGIYIILIILCSYLRNVRRLELYTASHAHTFAVNLTTFRPLYRLFLKSNWWHI